MRKRKLTIVVLMFWLVLGYFLKCCSLAVGTRHWGTYWSVLSSIICDYLQLRLGISFVVGPLANYLIYLYFSVIIVCLSLFFCFCFCFCFFRPFPFPWFGFSWSFLSTLSCGIWLLLIQTQYMCSCLLQKSSKGLLSMATLALLRRWHIPWILLADLSSGSQKFLRWH